MRNRLVSTLRTQSSSLKMMDDASRIALQLRSAGEVMLVRRMKRTVVIGAAAVALAVPAAFALAHGGEEWIPAAADEAEMLTTASGHPVPRESRIDFCPTQEQSDKHWEVYGFDYKPTVPCGDITNLDAPLHDHASGDADPGRPKTIAEAQALYDPEDDPNILIDHANGEFAVVLIQPVTPVPADIKTVEQFQKWAGTFRGGN